MCSQRTMIDVGRLIRWAFVVAALMLDGGAQAAIVKIPVNAQAPDYYAPDSRLPQRAANGAGLTPDNDGDGIEQHGVTPGGTMWLTNNTAASTDRWIRFDLNGLYLLDKMRVWNYNEPGGFLNRQVKTAVVEYSTDGLNWTALGGGPRTMATNATGLATYDDVEDVSFGGVPARFVRLGNPANPLVQINTSTGDHVGLSEVQFFGELRSVPGNPLAGVTATASTSYPGRGPEKVVNGVGLGADTDGDGIREHDNDANLGMWHSNNEVTPWIRFDAGQIVRLDQMRIWNYNEVVGNYINRGVKTATIKYAAEGQVANLNNPNDPGWTTLATSYPFTKGDRSAAYEGVDGVLFGSSGVLARHVLISVESNFGEPSYTGLSEVQLFGQVPLTGVTATASSQLAPPDNYVFNRPAANTVDGLGKTTTTPDGSPGSGVGMWLNAGNRFGSSLVNDTDPWIAFDLGREYALDGMVLYNYNEPGSFTNRGVQQAEVLVSLDNFVNDVHSLGVYTFAKAPGNATNPGQIVGMTGVIARYVKLDILSNHYGTQYHGVLNGLDNDFVGLNEVQFIGTPTPEPATLALAVLGLIGLLGVWKRKE